MNDLLKSASPISAAPVREADPSAGYPPEAGWRFADPPDDLTPVQWETLRLAYCSGGWNALPQANGNALRLLVEKGLVRRIQAARDPVADRRARAFHDSYARFDRELYWRFALTPRGRAVAEAAWGPREEGQSRTCHTAADMEKIPQECLR